jgi:CxxC motif-containing protein (DUF1111 family)
MKKRSSIVIISIVLTILGFSACSKLLPSMIDPSIGICGPISLSNAQTVLFSAGNDQFFANRTAATGLGPYFVATGCGSCHSSDNRGHPFTILTRFGQTDSTGNKFIAEGGPQLGKYCLPGLMPEQLPAGATSSQFIAPITAGVGFLEAVPDSEILAFAAANQNNPDGVRGHPNYDTIPSFASILPGTFPRADGKWICRFGRKASVYSLLQQVANAYNSDMGITSSFLPYDPYNYLDQTAPVSSSLPEVDNTTLNSVVFYCQCLQAPAQRNAGDSTVVYGGRLFMQIGCATCHQPTLTTGYSPIAGLSNQTFNPYTDLLVHDMGLGLDDGYTEGNAKTSEWRTAPLWALGLAPNVQGGYTYLLHDGRAHSIEQAIELHGGEAAVSEGRFAALSASDKNALVVFLKSL